ncbi:MAG: hypothetical protein QNJ13_11030 [Paracoccaceae bacterium]|nr:hypothetical protein [Paracoccaceae bacterium]
MTKHIEPREWMAVYAPTPSNERAPWAGFLLFAREWLRAPLRVGAVAPSGVALARAITEDLGARQGPVVELGPGTGVFTGRLLESGVPPADITVIEASAPFAAALALRFPGLRVCQGDAARVRDLAGYADGSVRTVICGLPLLSMRRAVVYRIMYGSFRLLQGDGEFRLFTYGPTCPVPAAIMERLDLVAERTTLVPANIPPAAVYRIRRRV